MRAKAQDLGDQSKPVPLMKAKEVAAWLNTTEGALAQLRFRSEGPPYLKLGRAIRYRRADIESFIGRHVELTRDCG